MTKFDFTHIDDLLQFTKNELLTEEAITKETRFRELSTWSSLTALLFLSGIHEETGALISSSELATCQTMTDIFRLIQSKRDGAAPNK